MSHSNLPRTTVPLPIRKLKSKLSPEAIKLAQGITMQNSLDGFMDMSVHPILGDLKE